MEIENLKRIEALLVVLYHERNKQYLELEKKRASNKVLYAEGVLTGLLMSIDIVRLERGADPCVGDSKNWLDNMLKSPDFPQHLEGIDKPMFFMEQPLGEMGQAIARQRLFLPSLLPPSHYLRVEDLLYF